MAFETSRNVADRGSTLPSAERAVQPGGVQVRERNGIWEVRDNGVFRGDYHQKEHALEAAARLKGSRR
ncbi:hypothetical protein EV216_13229 [Rhodovulum steppense]|uniref:DUF2188 domain-containing protein n=1 Tax=Rhodovulum steppense TaxID=540251 RepID=A0A4V2R3K7_9RHOB|nr:hypothetical protein EV216_13229 [Rhodovulum steppense]